MYISYSYLLFLFLHSKHIKNHWFFLYMISKSKCTSISSVTIKKQEITYLPKQSQPPDSLLSSLLLMVYSQFSCCSHYSACIWSHTALWRALFIASFDRVLRIVALLRKLCLLFLFVCILISFFST